MRFGLRELIFLVVLLAVPVASFVFVFKPRNEEIRQAEREVEIKTAKLEQLREVSARIDDLGAAIQEWNGAIEMIEAKLPSEQGIESILDQVWTLAQENRLEIIGTHPESPVPAATYMELPLKYQMFGDFDGFYQFLLELEQLPRITRVHQLKIVRAGAGRLRTLRGPKNAQGKELPEGTMEAEFVLSIYYESSQNKQQSQ